MAALMSATGLSTIDPLRIFSLLRTVLEIRRLVQSVPKNDRIDDLPTTGATQSRDADLTGIVLKVQIILCDQQSPRSAYRFGRRMAGGRVEDCLVSHSMPLEPSLAITTVNCLLLT
jgi:hypothetical protein